jgi:hypothetical protein
MQRKKTKKEAPALPISKNIIQNHSFQQYLNRKFNVLKSMKLPEKSPSKKVESPSKSQKKHRFS